MTLDDYTMILPIRERIQYLDRFFNYHRNYRIIAVDSSKDDHASMATKYSNVDYQWLGPTPHFQKMLGALDRVRTTYVSIGCDDDFYIASGIADCINILRQSAEAICAHGANVNFEETPRPNILYRNHKTLLRNRNLANRRPLSSAFERYDSIYRMQSYSPYNAVYRVEDLKKIIKIMLECGFDKPGANDHGFALVAVMFGNFLGSKELFCLKNLEAPPVRTILSISMVDYWEQLASSESIWKAYYDPKRIRDAVPHWKALIGVQARRETLLGRVLKRLSPLGLLYLIRPYGAANHALKQALGDA